MQVPVVNLPLGFPAHKHASAKACWLKQQTAPKIGNQAMVGNTAKANSQLFAPFQGSRTQFFGVSGLPQHFLYPCLEHGACLSLCNLHAPPLRNSFLTVEERSSLRRSKSLPKPSARRGTADMYSLRSAEEKRTLGSARGPVIGEIHL